MNETVQLNLAFILFLPWYLILAALYWAFPRQPRTLARWGFDAASLALASLATLASTQWSYRHADASERRRQGAQGEPGKCSTCVSAVRP